jgi:hypothetical protein
MERESHMKQTNMELVEELAVIPQHIQASEEALAREHAEHGCEFTHFENHELTDIRLQIRIQVGRLNNLRIHLQERLP